MDDYGEARIEFDGEDYYNDVDGVIEAAETIFGALVAHLEGET